MPLRLKKNLPGAQKERGHDGEDVQLDDEWRGEQGR
jgi:hypothetical protein